MKVKEYFSDDELRCRCGCRKAPDRRFIERLYALRLILGFPLNISSGARCLDHNREVGGSEGSFHLVGAVDVNKYDIEREGLIIQTAIKVGMTGIGIKDNEFIHLDDKHERMTFWSY